MYEYIALNIFTDERIFIFGYTFSDACERANINPEEWDCYDFNYID